MKANYRKLGEQFDNTAGGISNESRWYNTPEEKKRTRKKLTLPGLTMGTTCVFEQGWNNKSIDNDIVKLTFNKGKDKFKMIVSRVDLEQAVFAMAQADEVIKYFKSEAQLQAEHSKAPNKKHL